MARAGKDEEETPANRALYKTVGKRIRELRQARDLTQKELGALSEVRSTYIVEIEAVGVNLSLRLLQQFASALGVTARDLLPGPDQTETHNLSIPVVKKRIANLRDELTKLVRDELAKQIEACCNDVITFVDVPARPDQSSDD
jgi:transcriptional regulator with XRE-family HTH domain